VLIAIDRCSRSLIGRRVTDSRQVGVASGHLTGSSGQLAGLNAREMKTFYSPKIHGRYRQDTDMYKRQKRTIIRNIHYNMAVARCLTTTL